MKLGDPLPSLDSVTSWLDDEPVIARMSGRPVLVHFWSAECPLCHEGAHSVMRWRLQCAGRGLVTIAVYQLRPSEELDAGAAQRDARNLMRIDYPCALDGSRAIAQRFESTYPPGYYLFDRDHRLRHRQMGNANLHLLGALCERLVKASPEPEAY